MNGGKLADRTALCLGLLTVLANFGLSIEVSIAEQAAAATWEDYDADLSGTGFVTNGLNAVSKIAYFTAFFLKKKTKKKKKKNKYIYL